MVRIRELFIAAGAIAVLVVFAATGGCGGSKGGLLGGMGVDEPGDASGATGKTGTTGATAGSSSGPGFVSAMDSDASTDCTGLGCDVPAGCTTSLTGTVYDPAGANPLYNVVVYIPSDPAGTLPAIKEGTNSCNTCDVSIGDYVVATTSKADGSFELDGVPATTHVPLVVQIGKWRREVFIPTITSCAKNVLPGSTYTRLPAKRSEGNIPQMALVTGGADNLGCFLKGVGLDPSEYSVPGAGGRLDIYQGLPMAQTVNFGGFGGFTAGGAPGLSTGKAGDCTTDNADCVWNSKSNLEKYDIVLLACEGDTYDPDDADFGTGRGGGGGAQPSNKTPAAKQALHDWLNEGGKVFATHFHYTWFKNSPAADFRGIGNWLGASNGADMGSYTIDTSFPKAKVFDQWLGTVKAATGTQINLDGVAESVSTVNTAAQRWIYNPGTDPQTNSTNDTKYLSVLTPVGGIPPAVDAGETSTPQYCGKAVFSDLHAGGDPAGNIPGMCAGPPLSPQLSALEFLFFDLSACVSNDSLPPPSIPPPTK